MKKNIAPPVVAIIIIGVCMAIGATIWHFTVPPLVVPDKMPPPPNNIHRGAIVGPPGSAVPMATRH